MKNKIIAASFLIIIFCSGIIIQFYNVAADTLKVILDRAFAYESEDVADSEDETVVNVDTINSDILNSLSYKTRMVDLNGSILKGIGTRSYYNISNGINITTEGYNVGRYDQTSTDYEVQEMQSFKEYLDSKGIQLLYVSEPAKYIDDSFYMEQFGGESYLNRNTDLFLSRINELGIDYLDLRDPIRESGMDSLSLFYKTDHHWTVPASEWAASKVAEKLNTDFGYDIDLELYHSDSFQSVCYENCWLGEQGKKVSRSYIGLDDYTMMEPLYDTSYQVTASDGSVKAKGNFDIFINKDIYTSNEDYYSSPSWHYSYLPYVGSTIHNNNSNYGNILVLGDSYESSMLPFLTLGIQDVKLLVLRDIEGNVRDYIESGNYDTVIIAYAQFMIGAHDNPSSANYKMFTFGS